MHPTFILTAAHCGGGFLAGVNIGGILLDGTDAVETLAVDFEFPHPDYDEATQVNDIMLVKLTDPSTLSPVVQMNFDEVIPEIGDVVTLAGFGDTADGGDPSNELLMVTVDTYADDICFNLYNSYVPETMICAGTVAGGRDSCQGDSGGPLLTANNVQIGVVSTGIGCGEADLPAIYTKVAAFESFIRQGICSKCLKRLVDIVSSFIDSFLKIHPFLFCFLQVFRILHQRVVDQLLLPLHFNQP